MYFHYITFFVISKYIFIQSKQICLQYILQYDQNMISVIPRKTLLVEFHFSKFGCCKPIILPKNSTTDIFFFEAWRIFSE